MGFSFGVEHWVDYSLSVLRPQYSESHMNAYLLATYYSHNINHLEIISVTVNFSLSLDNFTKIRTCC